jgi:hypothetical protein
MDRALEERLVFDAAYRVGTRRFGEIARALEFVAGKHHA